MKLTLTLKLFNVQKFNVIQENKYTVGTILFIFLDVAKNLHKLLFHFLMTSALVMWNCLFLCLTLETFLFIFFTVHATMHFRYYTCIHIVKVIKFILSFPSAKKNENESRGDHKSIWSNDAFQIVMHLTYVPPRLFQVTGLFRQLLHTYIFSNSLYFYTHKLILKDRHFWFIRRWEKLRIDNLKFLVAIASYLLCLPCA